MKHNSLERYRLQELEELLVEYMEARGASASETLQSLDYAALGSREATLDGIIDGEREHQAVRAMLEERITED